MNFSQIILDSNASNTIGAYRDVKKLLKLIAFLNSFTSLRIKYVSNGGRRVNKVRGARKNTIAKKICRSIIYDYTKNVGIHGVEPCTSFLSGKRSTDELDAQNQV